MWEWDTGISAWITPVRPNKTQAKKPFLTISFLISIQTSPFLSFVPSSPEPLIKWNKQEPRVIVCSAGELFCDVSQSLCREPGVGSWFHFGAVYELAAHAVVTHLQTSVTLGLCLCTRTRLALLPVLLSSALVVFFFLTPLWGFYLLFVIMLDLGLIRGNHCFVFVLGVYYFLFILRPHGSWALTSKLENWGKKEYFCLYKVFSRTIHPLWMPPKLFLL